MKGTDEPLLYCRIVQNCAGVKKPQYSGQTPKYKNYRIGEEIKGREFNASEIPDNYMPTIKTIDGYLINIPNLIIIGEEQKAQVIDDKAILSERFKNKYSMMFSNSDGASGIVSDQKTQAKYILNGSIIGGTILLVYTFSKGGSKMSGFMFGAIIGGTIGKLFSNYKKNDTE